MRRGLDSSLILEEFLASNCGTDTRIFEVVVHVIFIPKVDLQNPGAILAFLY